MQVAADTTEAKQAIDALDNEPITLSTDADLSGAQDAIDQLGQSATTATGSSGGDGLSGMEGAVLGIEAASGAARGEIDSLGGAIGKLGPEAKAGGAAFIAFGAFIGEATALAADAEAQNKRFTDTFGPLADAVSHVNVGGLNITLEELGKQSGTTQADLEATASRIGLLGQSAGASDEQIVKTTDNLLALGATFSVNNPRLGDAAAVTDRLTNAFARGGRALAPFGLSLSSAQINAEALAETGKSDAAALTLFEKSTAGATLALQTFGDTLGDRFQSGAANAQIQLRALKVQIEETLVKVGGPLLKPLVDSLTALTPVAQSAAEILGAFARLSFPAIQILAHDLGAVTPILTLFADQLNRIADAEDALTGRTDKLRGSISFFGGAIPNAAGAFSAFEHSLSTLAPGIGPGISALRVLGDITSLFGHKAKEVAVDVGGIDDAFGSFADAATAGKASLTSLSSDLDNFVRSSLAVGDAGKRGSDAAKTLGLSIADIRGALLGTNDGFDQFVSHIDDSSLKTDKTKASFASLTNTLHQSRTEIEAQAEATLHAALDQGLLTRAQLDAAKVQAALNGDSRDYIAILAGLTPQIDRAAHAQQQNADVQFAGSAASKELQASIADGTVTMADAAAVATQYGISQTEATRIITDSIAAHDQAAAATAIHTQAFADLVDAIAQGTVTIPDAQAALHAMGFTMDGAATAAQNLASQVHSAVDKIVSNLPQAADAAKQWQSDIDAAFKQAEDDVTNHTGNIKDDLATLAADSDPKKFAENLNAQTASVLNFQANLSALLRRGQDAAAQFVVQLLQSGDFDIAAQLAAAMVKSPSGTKIDEASIGIAGRVNTSLGQLLGQHASELGLAFGTDLGNGIVVGGGPVNAAVDSVSAGLAEHFHPEFHHQVSTAMAAAATALQADPTIGQAAGAAGLRALARFESTFGPTDAATAVKVTMEGARQAIAENPALATAAANKGDETKRAFGSKADIKAAASKEFAAAAALIPGLTNVPNVAGLLGVQAGEAFGQGLANGIDAKKADIVAAATRVANAAAIAVAAAHISASPSKVAIRLGKDFSTGLAIGIGDTRAVNAAATGIAQSITASTAAAFRSVGVSAVSQIVVGFNDPTTIAAAEKSLKDLVAQATATTSGASSSTASFDQFVSSIVTQLPDAANAVSQFGSTWNNAVSTQANALATYHKAHATYRADIADENVLVDKTRAAYVAWVAAANAVNAAVASHAPQGVVNEARAAAAAAQADFERLSEAVKNGTQTLSSDRSNITSAASGLIDANKAIVQASNPEGFIRNLREQTNANRQFEANLRTLLRFGDTDLANALAKAGPEAAGHLAAGLASSRSKARMAEAAIDNANHFTDTFSDFITSRFAPKVQTQLATAVATAAPPDVTLTANTAPVLAAIGQIAATVPLTILPTVAPFTPPNLSPAALSVVPQLVLPLPALDPIDVRVIPHLDALPDLAVHTATVVAPAVQPNALAANALAQPSLPQTLELDLTINVPGGQTLTATAEFLVPRPSPTTTKTRLAAAVNAKVLA